MYCMLYGDINECYERLTHWRLSQHAKKVRVAAQPYRDPNSKNTPPPMAEEDGEVGDAQGVFHVLRL